MPPRKRARAAPAAAAAPADAVTVDGGGGSACTMLAKLDSFREQGILVDVKIEAGGEEFPAHRAVLAGCSDFFTALFSSQMRDSESPTVSLDDISGPVLSAALDFMYKGWCSVEARALPALLEAAARLQMAQLQSTTLDAIKCGLSPTTALSTWATADRLTLPTLVAAASKAAADHFEDIAKSDALLEGTHAQLLALLQREDLCVASEESVFAALVRWQAHHQPAEQDLHILLRHMRFGCMPFAFLQQTVRAWPPMATGAGKDLLLDAVAECLPGGTPPTARKRPRTGIIEWVSFHENLVISTGDEGETTLTRTSESGWDVALGKEALTVGQHEWRITLIPRWFACGVAEWGCEKHTFPRNTRRYWALFTVPWLELSLTSGNNSPAWTQPTSRPTEIRVLLDMDARTLSFAFDGGEPRLAFVDLPAAVHPLVNGGVEGLNFKVS